ncbi:MAG: iron ABC transporter permease [Paracoccaceae bacterium]
MTRTGARAPIGVALVFAAMLPAFALHVSIGATAIPLATVAEAFAAYDPTAFDHVVIREHRAPRALFAATVGAALAVAGALMQGVTRNPLADPGLLGLLAGAAFAVSLAVGAFDLLDPAWTPAVAAGGALAGAALVGSIAAAAPGGATPITLILAGAAVTAFLGALTTLALLLDEATFQALRVWLTGSLSAGDRDVFLRALPWFGAGFVVAFALARQVTALALGEEAAIGVGVQVLRLRAFTLLAVVALTAAAVAVAGPVGFVGLVVPHAARLLFGSDYRRIVPGSAALGGLGLLLIDVAARRALAPIEISTGIVTALIGAPVFVWLIRARL